MSAKLSRRYGQVCLYPPIRNLPLEEQRRLNSLTLRLDTEFEDLPERYRRAILEAEAHRQQAIDVLQSGGPSAHEHLWEQWLGVRRALKSRRAAASPRRGTSPGAIRAPAAAEPATA